MRYLVIVAKQGAPPARTIAVHAETAQDARKKVEANCMTRGEHVERVTLIA